MLISAGRRRQPEAEYRRLRERQPEGFGMAEEWGLPPLPGKLPSGNYPAVEYARALAMSARSIEKHSAFSAPLQRRSVPTGGVGRRFVGALQELQQRLIGCIGGSHPVVRQNKFAQGGVV